MITITDEMDFYLRFTYPIYTTSHNLTAYDFIGLIECDENTKMFEFDGRFYTSVFASKKLPYDIVILTGNNSVMRLSGDRDGFLDDISQRTSLWNWRNLGALAIEHKMILKHENY